MHLRNSICAVLLLTLSQVAFAGEGSLRRPLPNNQSPRKRQSTCTPDSWIPCPIEHGGCCPTADGCSTSDSGISVCSDVACSATDTDCGDGTCCPAGNVCTETSCDSGDGVPSITIPSFTIPPFTIPSFTILSFTIPSLPEPSLPEFSITILSFPEPSITIPSFPEPSLPEPSLPEPSLPEPSLPGPSLPEPSLPEPSLPEPSLPEPSLPTTVQTTVQTPVSTSTDDKTVTSVATKTHTSKPHTTKPSVSTITEDKTATPIVSKNPPQNTPTPKTQTGITITAGGTSALQPTEGVGIGIKCSLVQSASSAYKEANSLSSTDDTLVSYYAQALHMACLRSSPGCKIPECDMVKNVRKFVPLACQGGEDLGSEFEEAIFSDLVQGSSFSDVAGQQGKANLAVKDLAQQIDNKDIASPFLNFMLSAGEARDTQSLAKTYYSTVQVFDDLQPILDNYFKGKVADSDSGSIRGILNQLAHSHSQFMRCGVGVSYFAQTTDNKGSSASKAVTLPPAAAAAASFFVPVVAAQLRNDQLIKAIESTSSLDLGSASIADLADYLRAQLPKSPNLQYDTRNWLFPGSNNNGTGNAISEASALLEQSFVKEEMSKSGGSHVTLTNELYAVLELETSRKEKNLSDFMAASGLFFATPNGDQAFKPIKLSIEGRSFTIVGPIGMVFPAASDFIPGSGTRANASDPKSNPSENPNGITKGTGGGLNPVPPTDADLASVLYKSATLRLQIDPVHYVDARPKINASQHFYVLDLVSGKEIPGTYSVLSVGGKDREGNPMEFGMLEAQLEFGQGVWAGGWSGGGAFAVGVRDWVELQSDAATFNGMWRGVPILWGWVMVVILVAGI